MKIRNGVAAIIFTRIRGKKKYLLLKRKLYWCGWEWLKGGRKKGEREIECLKREIKEETGKRVEEYIVKKTPIVHKFVYIRPYVHDYVLWDGSKNRVYIIEFNNSKVNVDNNEHCGHRWVSRKDALRMITWDDQRKIFDRLTKKL